MTLSLLDLIHYVEVSLPAALTSKIFLHLIGLEKVFLCIVSTSKKYLDSPASMDVSLFNFWIDNTLHLWFFTFVIKI